jgi:uncharacterized protein (TIGR03435 family)
MKKKLWMAAVCLVFALPHGGAWAQAVAAPQTTVPDAKMPAYDVAVIRLNKSGSGLVNIWSNTDNYKASNVSLRVLLQDAYGIKEDLISGIPAAVNSARFDVEAKVVDPDVSVLKKLNENQRRGMLRDVLFERFQLKAHLEVKTLPVYEMVIAKHGPKFKPSVDGGKDDGGTSVRGSRSGVKFTARDITMASFADSLHRQVDRTVLDKTGLPGKYDISLQWSKDDLSGADSGPSILFTALQEQLGLQFRAAKGPVETLVVDHAEMPSEN